MSPSHNPHHPKLKPPPRAFFSCGIFRHCTQSVLSPTSTPPETPPVTAAAIPPPPLSPTRARPPPPPPPRAATSTSSSSSSSSTSQSFTQWRLFPLHHQHIHEPPEPRAPSASHHHAVTSSVGLAEAFRSAEEQFSSGATLSALRLLEKSLAGDSTGGPCTPAIMAGVVAALQNAATARPAAKVLLELLLAEKNRRAAVDAGAVAATIEAVAGSGGQSGRANATAERALAALELLCTVEEGAAAVRTHALAAAALAGAAEGMSGRGKECAIGVLAAVYGGENAGEAPLEVGRAAVAAVQGKCTARGRRKGAQLLRALQGSGRLDVGADGY